MTETRREVSSRSNIFIRQIAIFLNKHNISPNIISTFSIILSLLVPIGCYIIYINQNVNLISVLLILSGIQLRLLCNVIDGLVAIEGGKKSVVGGIYNEFPDRITDTIIILSISFLINLNLGFILSILAIMTAYVRLLGGTLGVKQTFAGPAAKQHRMFFFNILIIAGLFLSYNHFIYLGYIFLIFLNILTFITVLHRLHIISKELKKGE